MPEAEFQRRRIVKQGLIDIGPMGWLFFNSNVNFLCFSFSHSPKRGNEKHDCRHWGTAPGGVEVCVAMLTYTLPPRYRQ